MITMRLVLCMIFLFISLSIYAESDDNNSKKNNTTEANKKIEKTGIPLNLVKDEISKCTNNINGIMVAECDANEVALGYRHKLVVIGFSEKDMQFYNKNKKLSPETISQIKSAATSLVGISNVQPKENLIVNYHPQDESDI